MMHFVLLAALELLELHGPDGQVAWLNEASITSLRAPNARDLRTSFPKGVRCIVVGVNGKFLAVTESCEQIRDMLIAVPK